MAEKPPSLGLRHVALFVPDEAFDACLRFYVEGLGLAIDWQPDPDNVYLSGGADNLALHRAAKDRVMPQGGGTLDHMGFCMPEAEHVHDWFRRLESGAEDWGIELLTAVKTHRDGATSFYFLDPGGVRVQMLHIPGLE